MKPTKLFPAVEIKIMVLRETPVPEQIITEPHRICEFWLANVTKSTWYQTEQEQLVGIALDSKMRVRSFYLITLGLASETLVHAREVFRPAVMLAASHVVLAHNHPSGDPMPSASDVRSTRELSKAGGILGIPLTDHVIIGVPSATLPRGYVSMKELGMLE